MKVLLFEDNDVANLYPLTYLRPVFDLRCGAFSLKEKVAKRFPDAGLYVEVREELAAVAAEAHGRSAVNSPAALAADDDLLLLNAGAILTGDSSSYGAEECVGRTAGGAFVWAFVKKETLTRLAAGSGAALAEAAAAALPARAVDDVLIRYGWDLVDNNPSQIVADYEAWFTPQRRSTPMDGAAIAGPEENLWIGEGVEIQPHTWIDCREGPVIISDGCTITAHTSIHAPCFLGKDVRTFEAKIREGCSIGPVCRVGGEIEESIIHGYANKYHTGFLGHSYVCEWVNLGALTTNSDLKNDYGTVKVYVQGKPIDSGSIKVGSLIGDHTKTSIGTMLNTGSHIGIMCNLMAGSSVLPKFVPSFAWYLQDRISKSLGIEYSLSTARTAMGRRKQELSPAMEELIRRAEDLTRDDRMDKIARDRRKLRGR
jgi:UDP-N-acetylglucosamine diphosphorylase/glucosamine-1-phosphate N-acetyltransferase